MWFLFHCCISLKIAWYFLCSTWINRFFLIVLLWRAIEIPLQMRIDGIKKRHDETREFSCNRMFCTSSIGVCMNYAYFQIFYHAQFFYSRNDICLVFYFILFYIHFMIVWLSQTYELHTFWVEFCRLFPFALLHHLKCLKINGIKVQLHHLK